MGHTAIVHFPSNFCKVQFIVNDEFFYLFYFVKDNEVFDGDAFSFWKNLGHVTVVLAQLFTKKIREIDYQ